MQLGQSRTLPVEKPEQIDLAQAARYFGARGEADTATMALLRLNARQAATSQDYMDVREEVLHEIDRIAAAKGIHLDPTVVYGLGDKAVPMEAPSYRKATPPWLRT